MKRFRERIEEKATAARNRLHNMPNDKQHAFIKSKQVNPNNKKIAGLTKRIVSFWRNGRHVMEEAWLTKVEEAVFNSLGQKSELADQRIQRAEDEAIDAVVFLDEADAVKALVDFEKALLKIK